MIFLTKRALILLILLIPFSFLSCDVENNIALNGTWLITDMTFQGQPTYPKTTNESITDFIQGYEDYETLSFRIVDSTVVLPGFNSQKLTTNFAFENNQLIITSHDDVDPALELTNLIFSGTYAVSFSESEHTLKLTSDKTTLNLIYKDEVMRKAMDGLFE